MKTVLSLSESDRRFLADVSQLAFGNPYGEATQAVHKTLGGGAGGAHDLAHAQVRALFEGMRKQRELSIANYAEQDRQLLHHALLFDGLHVSSKAFDALVAAQIDKGAQACRAPFIAPLLERLTQIGMAKSVALHHVAIYYQMRRAHYFLDTVLVGCSMSMQKLRHDLWNSIFTHDFLLYERYLWDRMRELSTLFIGGAGTGKRLAAAAVSFCSYIPFIDKTELFAESFANGFTQVRVATFSGLRLESELFGHQKMAYAEALENFQGVFSRCTATGTIFLDNILEVPLPVQARLLGVLQDRIFTPVGDHVSREFRGRIMAAAPGNMESIRSGGQIRNDLIYHLGVNTIAVPSLKQRLQENPGDLERLILHILGKFVEQNAEQQVGRIIEQMHEHVGHGYDWPGNLLELEQIVKRILMVSHYESKA